MRFWIDVENSSFVRLGDGPILTATYWESVVRLDRAGTFRFSMPASDPRAALVVEKRVVRCATVIRGTITTIGAGVVDKIELSVDEAGKAIVNVSGDDLLRELTYILVGELEIGTEATPDTGGPADIATLFPAGWSLDIVNGYNVTVKSVWHKFDGETVLAALIKLAELTGEHFRVGDGRKVVWMKTDQPASGIRAVKGVDGVAMEGNNDVCIIRNVTRETDAEEMVSRIIPYGAGEGAAKITLTGTTWTAPAGYTLNAASNYIKRDATETSYARIEQKVDFKDVKNADMLAEQAYEWLERHSAAEKFYRADVAQLDLALDPGDWIQVYYQQWVDGYHAVDIDANLIVMEVTRNVDASGVRTANLLFSSTDRYPNSDSDTLVNGINQSQAFYTHAQPLDADDLDASPTPGLHASSHADGGADEVALTAVQITDLYDVAGTTKTISAGVITKGAGRITWHKVDTEGAAATDDLDTINGGAEGDILFLSTLDNARDVVLKDATGNLRLTVDLGLNSAADLACLIYIGGLWREVSFSDIA
jgi:hypothetical protein